MSAHRRPPRRVGPRRVVLLLPAPPWVFSLSGVRESNSRVAPPEARPVEGRYWLVIIPELVNRPPPGAVVDGGRCFLPASACLPTYLYLTALHLTGGRTIIP